MRSERLKIHTELRICCICISTADPCVKRGAVLFLTKAHLSSSMNDDHTNMLLLGKDLLLHKNTILLFRLYICCVHIEDEGFD